MEENFSYNKVHSFSVWYLIIFEKFKACITTISQKAHMSHHRLFLIDYYHSQLVLPAIELEINESTFSKF